MTGKIIMVHKVGDTYVTSVSDNIKLILISKGVEVYTLPEEGEKP